MGWTRPVPSGQVEPDSTGPVGGFVRAGRELFEAGAPGTEVAAAWNAILLRPEFAKAPPQAKAAALADAGGVHIRLYERSGAAELLADGIELLHRAVEIAPPDSPQRRQSLSYLGVAYGLRFDRSGDTGDLRMATDLCNQSIQAIDANDWRAPVYVLNLGLQVERAYRQSKRQDLLAAAIELLSEAARVTRPGSRVHRSASTVLSRLFLERYEQTHDRRDLEQATQWGKRALET
jgi:hypothetical protein